MMFCNYFENLIKLLGAIDSEGILWNDQIDEKTKRARLKL